jgi:hypothetical protein
VQAVLWGIFDEIMKIIYTSAIITITIGDTNLNLGLAMAIG